MAMRNKTARHLAVLAISAFTTIGSLPSISYAQEHQSDLRDRANAALADSDYSKAEAILRELTEREGEDATVLFQLARAIHGQNDYDRAMRVYNQARSAGFQPSSRIDYHMARIEAERGEHAAAITLLRKMAETSGPIAATIEQTPEFAVLVEDPEFQTIVAGLKPCALPQQRQFDFWVGTWRVTAAGGPNGGATSRIESIQNGCAVLENYSAGNFAGTSINFYDPTRKVWHQSWMSNTGNVFYAEGGLNERGEMILTDRDLEISKITGTINKVTWTPLDGGSVRQHWQASTDDGASWTTVFDGHYEPVDR